MSLERMHAFMRPLIAFKPSLIAFNSSLGDRLDDGRLLNGVDQ